MKKRYFVAGTDTDVGKTRVACGLLDCAAQAGFKTLAMKPVAAGCEETPEGLRNADALALQAACTEPLKYQQVNPYALREPIAPHIAAVQQGVNITNQRLAGFTQGLLLQRADWLLVEGAGGWRLPLNNMEFMSGYAKTMQMQVILVVGMKLGCLNHALLSAESILRDGVELVGWVANRIDPAMSCYEENLAYLQQQMPGAFLGAVPYLDDPAASCAEYLSIDALK